MSVLNDPNKLLMATVVGAVTVSSAAVYLYYVWKPRNNLKKTDGDKTSKKKSTSTRNTEFLSPTSSSPTPITTRSTAFTPVSKDSPDNLRGYKKTTDGRTTSYFHREISAEEKSLIGDCRPQQIITSTSTNSVNSLGKADSTSNTSSSSSTTSNTSSSAWNAAGTWEERDYTQWAKDKLSLLLLSKDTAFASSSCSARVTKVNRVTGDASVTFSRGRKKFIYDFTLVVEWKVS